MSHQPYKKCLTFGAGCSLLLASFLPQAVSAGQVVQFTLEGALETMDELTKPWYPRFDGVNFAGATLSGFINVDLDTYSSLFSGIVYYQLDDWSLQLTASGETIYFNPVGDAREDANILRVRPSNDSIEFTVVEYGYIDERDEYGNPLGAPQVSFVFELPVDVSNGSKLEDVLGGDLSLTSSRLSYGFAGFGVNNNGRFNSASFSVSPVPEPSTLALLGLGGVMVFGLARRQQAKHAKKAKQAALI